MTSNDHGLWDWSLSHYDQPGVCELLLRLQDDYGFNVNIALWCCWCAKQSAETPEPILRQAVDETARWNETVTANLRIIRRYLKTHIDDTNPQESDLRKQVKRAELQAEYVEQMTLQRIADEKLTSEPSEIGILQLAQRNLRIYDSLINASSKKYTPPSLLESLVTHIFIAESAAHNNQG